MDESDGNGEGLFHNFSNNILNQDAEKYNKTIAINFLDSGQKAATFSWNDKRTLLQIEKITGYRVRPRGVVSQYKYGGFIIYEKDGHGLIAAKVYLGEMNWISAKKVFDELFLNGYSDWHFPTEKELNLVYTNLAKFGGGGFKNLNETYWSSSIEGNNRDVFVLCDSGLASLNIEYGRASILAVRAF